jgi:hypothetical protein
MRLVSYIGLQNCQFCQNDQHEQAASYCSTVGFFPFIVVPGGGVNCGIYTGSYNSSNIPYLNSLPLSFSANSWNSFKRYHFCIYLHVYTVLYQFHPPTPCSVISLLPLMPAFPPDRTCSNFVEERERIRKKVTF